ncbi:MAG: hypothetical protein BAJALOKI3v1_150048 [Promethearchaeota archaeon]|nr:MAG: hypothetical protein BAJALOKI3v1_150048 [Candidatus Lokiarchaeota archaeon]
MESYLEWKPIISPEEVYSDLIGLNNLSLINSRVCWLESRPSEGGRNVLVLEDSNNNTTTDITPENYYIRTRVHEYGGGAYAVNDDHAYFVNFGDQRIYRQFLHQNDKIVPITPELNEDGSLGKYASLELMPNGKYLIFVYEKEYKNKENKNFLACIDIKRSDSKAEPILLHEGYDFYGVPRFSNDGAKIAWLSWNHPHMPWDKTILWEGEFKDGKIKNPKKIIDMPLSSICFPQYDPEGNLYFVMDKANYSNNDYQNFWNIYSYSRENGEIFPITDSFKEFGEPLWWFGNNKYTFLDTKIIISSYTNKGRMHLCEINTINKNIKPFDFSFTEYSSVIKVDDNVIAFIAAGPKTIPSVYKYNIKEDELKRLKKSTDVSIPEKDISTPKLIQYESEQGNNAYGHLYLPKNHNYSKNEKKKPPLLVRIHGGPTARASTNLSLITQYWTSSGFAVFDIDYHGSTGYGRKYRDALKGEWGILDAYDIKSGVRYLIENNIVNKERCAITGGRAGGYAAQRVLTLFPELFQAGASYFGIGNLKTLVELTHKFESRYIDALVGGNIKNKPKVFKERSPINHLKRLKSPLIIFQGEDDKIVPPENSREMAKILTEKGISNQYVEYENEAHGFRIRENKIDSLRKESDFYRKIFKSNKE